MTNKIDEMSNGNMENTEVMTDMLGLTDMDSSFTDEMPDNDMEEMNNMHSEEMPSSNAGEMDTLSGDEMSMAEPNGMEAMPGEVPQTEDKAQSIELPGHWKLVLTQVSGKNSGQS